VTALADSEKMIGFNSKIAKQMSEIAAELTSEKP
jgi:hypothetical protein